MAIVSNSPVSGWNRTMPIMLAHRSNSTRAKVGRPLCNKCFNSTRKEWYHGVKLHVLAMLRPGKLPIPIVSQISQASLCDLWAAQRIDWDCTPISHGCVSCRTKPIPVSYCKANKAPFHQMKVPLLLNNHVLHLAATQSSKPLQNHLCRKINYYRVDRCENQ